MILPLLFAAATVLPSDRLAMADRLFNRAKYAEAAAEYAALEGENAAAADEILYRRAECERALGHNDAARKLYSDLVLRFPDSRHAGRCRFLYAIGATGETRLKLLAALDTDRVDTETRAAALYHLGAETSSAEVLSRCVKLAPKGRYAEFANLRCGAILAASAITAERRKGVEILLGLAFGKSALASEALYLAAIQSYRGKNYGEAGSLFRRYRKNFPKDEHAEEARTMSVWCDFMQGRFTDAAVGCGEGGSDDLDYVRAACAYSLGENEKALRLFRKYLDDYPQGKYRADAELPIARIEFDTASASGNGAQTVETARRGYGLSKLAADELRLAWAYEKAEKIPEARAEYTSIVKNHPGTEEAAEALFRRAMIDARAEQWASAELSLAEALATGKCDRYRGEALYWRGVAALNLGHEKESADFLRESLGKGISLDQTREARLMIADYDLRTGNTEAAKKAYEVLVAEGACARMNAARILAVGKLLGGSTAKTCAAALVKMEAPEWRQAGWVLLGTAEESAGAFTAAIDAYSKAMAEPVKTEELATASLRLGKLQARAGDREAAERTLKQSVALNAADTPDAIRSRAEAYLELARNAVAKGDVETARVYATVVTSLFNDPDAIAAAEKILADHPEEKGK